MKLSLKVFLAFLSILIALYLGVLSYILLITPFEYKEVDFNDNGILTVGEMGYVMSYGKRKSSLHGDSCTEYFAHKDGLTIKMVCE